MPHSESTWIKHATFHDKSYISMIIHVFTRLHGDGIEMAKCPKCNKEVAKTVKEWDMGKLHIKLYECCGKKFREVSKKK
ncbi:MAG TPA: hypothetical protein VJ574_02455 [Candidatus Bathyarchaeia archaeon]|nr:hypothetical protein [Candidatus Bathyarchaeia archaeon]